MICISSSFNNSSISSLHVAPMKNYNPGPGRSPRTHPIHRHSATQLRTSISSKRAPTLVEFLPFGMMTWQMMCQKPLFYTTSRDMRKLLTDCTNATKLHKNNTETTGLKLKGTDHRPQRLKLLRRPVETAMKHWDCWRKKRRSSGLFHLKISSDILLLVTPFTLLPLFQPPNFSALEALASCNPCLGGCQTLLRLPQCPKKSKAPTSWRLTFLGPSTLSTPGRCPNLPSSHSKLSRPWPMTCSFCDKAPHMAHPKALLKDELQTPKSRDLWNDWNGKVASVEMLFSLGKEMHAAASWVHLEVSFLASFF